MEELSLSKSRSFTTSILYALKLEKMNLIEAPRDEFKFPQTFNTNFNVQMMEINL